MRQSRHLKMNAITNLATLNGTKAAGARCVTLIIIIIHIHVLLTVT